MKLINLLDKIANSEIKPIIYFRINSFGYNYIIKYLYYEFIIEEVDSSFSTNLFKKGESFNKYILSSLNKEITIIENKFKEGDYNGL